MCELSVLMRRHHLTAFDVLSARFHLSLLASALTIWSGIMFFMFHTYIRDPGSFASFLCATMLLGSMMIKHIIVAEMLRHSFNYPFVLECLTWCNSSFWIPVQKLTKKLTKDWIRNPLFQLFPKILNET